MAECNTTTAEGPCLLSRIDAGTAAVNSVSVIVGEDSVISASDDKTVRVWVRRENNQYWPSVIQNFTASCSVMIYEKEGEGGDGHLVYVGLANGEIHEFRLSSDLNRFERKRTFRSHTNRVTCLKLVPAHNWILSTARDKRLQWSCTQSGRDLGTHEFTAWCLAVEYDEKAKYAFVADFSGDITVMKLEENNIHRVTALKGHSGSVWALTYDPERRVLFSGGFDNTIVVWDIGSQQGTAFELNGHTDKIRSLYYSSQLNKLLSCGEDGYLWLWDMDREREEAPTWEKADRCVLCGSAFFWNFRGMWSDKRLPGKVVVRQHHCRKCGRSVCDSCSDRTSVFPRMGFETPVRMCNECYTSITPADRQPFAHSFNLKLTVTSVSILHKQNLLVTGNDDKTVRLMLPCPYHVLANKVSIKVWDISGISRQSN